MKKENILNCNNILQYLYYLLTNKCSLGEHKRFLKKKKKILQAKSFELCIAFYINMQFLSYMELPLFFINLIPSQKSQVPHYSNMPFYVAFNMCCFLL